MLIELNLPLDYQESKMPQYIWQALPPKERKKRSKSHLFWVYRKKSIDARKKNDVHVHLRLEILDKESELLNLPSLQALLPNLDSSMLEIRQRPVVIGLGPAGLFAAYYLSLAGLKPLVYEQGKGVDERIADVETFWKEAKLNPYSNCQYGEGGAGTFSDGKLHTGIKSPWIQSIFSTLVQHGAPSEIMYDAHPHVGTDLLPDILISMRKEMMQRGATFFFQTKFLSLSEGKTARLALRFLDLKKMEENIVETDQLFLAIGHSSRQTYLSLAKAGMNIQAKPMAIGVRIEHPQALIDCAQYGLDNVQTYRSFLPASPYKLTYQTAKGRGVYSFCMCPGGEVIACSSEPKQVVTNGMSRYKRAAYHANSALLVNVTVDDYTALLPDLAPLLKENERLASFAKELVAYPELKGILLQESLEYLAFLAGGSSYKAPSMTVAAFLERVRLMQQEGRLTFPTMKQENEEKGFFPQSEPRNEPYPDFMMGEPSYQPGIIDFDLTNLLPQVIYESIAEALPAFARRMKGFDFAKARLYAIESRSSAPVRLIRDEVTRMSNIAGVYPIGEGAGYAGGITSSAVDALKSVQAFLQGL